MEQEKKNQNQPAAQEPSVGDQIKVRREKLASLQAEGRNPFEITKFVQTTNSAEIKAHFYHHPLRQHHDRTGDQGPF